MSNSLDSALKITFLTAASYVVAFAYEGSYLGYFGVPIDFVEVDLRSLLLFGFALWTTGVILYGVGFISSIPLSVLFFSPQHILLRIIGYPVAMFVAWAVAWAFELESAIAYSVYGAILLIAAADLVWPLYEQRGKGLSYSDKLAASKDARQTSNSVRTRDADGTFVWKGLAAVILVAFGAIVLGIATAKTKRDFLIAGDCIALRVTGDKLLCAIWGRQLTGEYEFRSVEGVRLTMERIGPLQRYTHQELRPAPAKSKAPVTDRPDSRIAPLTN